MNRRADGANSKDVQIPSLRKITEKPQKPDSPEKIRLAPMNRTIQTNLESTHSVSKLLTNTSRPLAILALRSDDIAVV